MANTYRVFLYKPEAVSVTADNAGPYFLGELLVDNLDVSIKLQDISTVAFNMPRIINGEANTRIDEVLDGYVIELWYGDLTGTLDVDYYRYRFTIYSTPVNFSDNKFLHNYTGYSLEALAELKMLVSWPGIEISDFYRKISYNNTEATPKFLEPKDTGTGGNFEYTITTSGSGADYITVTPTTAVATDIDIFIYEVRQRLSSGNIVSESEAGLIPYSGTGPDDAEFKNGYYFLTISGGYVTQIDIALPDNYTDFNGESVSTQLLFFKLYDNPLSRRYAIGITTNAEQANDMYIDLAHDVAEGNPTDYEDFNFQTQTFYSKNGLTLKQVLLGKENTSTTTITEDGLLHRTGFGLGTVHASLENVYRSNLEFNNVTRYAAIKTLAESFDAIAVYDTVNNTVSFYPENIYGVNNGLIIRYGAYLKSLNKEIDASKIITNAIGLGKDNLTINLVNPTGEDYWEDYSYYLDDYYISSSAQIENLTEDGSLGIDFDYVSTTGYSSRWMSASLAEKVAKWQYTRDWFHGILTGDYNPVGFSSTTTQFYNFYANRLEAIRLLIKQETEYFTALKREVKFEAFKNYYEKLHKDSPSNTTYENKYNYYVGELAAAKAANQALYSDLEDARADIFDEDTAGSYAAKMVVLRGFLQKDSASRNINLNSLAPFQRETVVNDNSIDDEKDLLDIVKTHVDENKEPKVTVSIDIADILAAQEAQEDWNKVKVGDKINIYLDELNVDVVAQIREINVNFEDHTLSFVISTVRNYNKGFGNFISRTIRNLYNANNNNVQYEIDGNRYSRETSENVNDVLDNGLNTADTPLQTGLTDDSGNSGTQTTGAGTTSATIAEVDPLTETVTSYVNTATEGVIIADGKFLAYHNYTSPTTYTSEVEISADTGFTIRKISSGTITKQVYIDTEGNASFAGKLVAPSGDIGGWTIDTDRLYAGSTTTRVELNADSESDYAIFAGNETAASAPFSVTKDGDLVATSATITGTINATSGTFNNTITVGTDTDTITIVGASTAAGTKIYSGDGNYAEENTGFYLDATGKFSLGNQLYWDGEGNLQILGNLVADTGTIGGFTITGDTIQQGNDTSKLALQSDGTNPFLTIGQATNGYNETGIFLGLDSGVSKLSLKSGTNSLLFDGTNLSITGAITATSGSFTGAITSTSGEIGGWTIGADSLTGGDATLNSSGNLTLGTSDDVVRLSANDATYRVWVGNATAASAPFSVDKDGNIKSTAGEIAGWSINSTRLLKSYDAGLTNDVNIYAGVMPSAISTPGAGEFGFAVENTNPDAGYPFLVAMTNKGFYVFTDTDAANTYANPVSAMEITYNEDYIWAKGLLISDDKNIANANVAIGTLATTDGEATNWGLVVNNGTATDGSSVTIDKDGIEIIKTVDSVDTSTFSVDVDGNVSVAGNIVADSGFIGDLIIGREGISLGAISFIDFEKPGSWDNWTFTGSYSITSTSDYILFGTKSLQIVAGNTATLKYDFEYDNINLPEKYFLEFSYITPDTTGTDTGYIKFYNEDGLFETINFSSLPTPTQSNSPTIVIPENSDYVEIEILTDESNYYMDQIKISRGDFLPSNNLLINKDGIYSDHANVGTLLASNIYSVTGRIAGFNYGLSSFITGSVILANATYSTIQSTQDITAEENFITAGGTVSTNEFYLTNKGKLYANNVDTINITGTMLKTTTDVVSNLNADLLDGYHFDEVVRYGHIYGKASVAISKGDAVQFDGVQGDHILIKPAVPSEINANPDYFIGMAREDVALNDFTNIVTFGEIIGTTGDPLDTATNFNEGDILWFASAGAINGAITSTEPGGINAKIQVGAVTKENATEGIILVRVSRVGTDVADIKASGTPSASTFLRGDGSWATPGDTDTNTYVTSAAFNTGTGVLTLTRNDAATVTVDLDGKYAESSHTHGNILDNGTITASAVAIETGDRLLITNNNNSQLIERSLDFDTSVTNTFLRRDGTWATPNDTNTYVTSAAFNTGTGVLTITRNDAATVTVDLDGKYAEGSHTHGNINNDGTITTNIAPAIGQHLVITSTDDLIQQSNITLGNATTTYLRNDGSWGTPTGTYSLPLAASGTRGGVQLGATQTEINRALVLDGDEDAYVALPRQIPAVTLNNASSTSPSFYAPTGGGTVSQVLISSGATSEPSWDYVLKDISNFTGAVVSNGATAVLIPLDETLSTSGLYAIEVNANTSTSVEGRTIHFFECPTLNDTVTFFQNDHTNSSSSTTIYKFELLNTSGSLYIDDAYQHLIGTSITASTGIRIWRVYRVMSHGG